MELELLALHLDETFVHLLIGIVSTKLTNIFRI
jgi:hypothetical protein